MPMFAGPMAKRPLPFYGFAGAPQAEGMAGPPPMQTGSQPVPQGGSGNIVNGQFVPDQLGQPAMAQGAPAMAQAAPQAAQAGMFAGGGPRKAHKGLFPGKDGKTWARIAGDMLLNYSASLGNPAAQSFLQNQHQMMRDRQRAAMEMEQEQWKANQPRFEQVGDTIGMFNPVSQQFEPIYRDAQPFEAYADSSGLERGSPEWQQKVEDYRLGAWSDPAVEAKTGLLDHRFDRSDAQLGQRLNVTRRGQDLRYNATIRGQDIGRENNVRSMGQSDANNRRSTGTSRANNVLSNSTRLSTSGKPGTPVMVNTPEEARKLPPGTKFMRPDGTVMVR